MIRIKQCVFLILLNSLFLITQSSQATEILRLSTTTSTENSGLLAILNPVFEAQYNTRIDVIAVGTGKALRIGASGDVDVVFVHAPKAELDYVQQGDFINRVAVMHNDFIIVGAKTDPAQLHKATTITAALRQIAQSQSLFISRGDDSGTHKKEQYLWQQATIKPQGDWYLAVGQGMGAVLRIANDKQAYTLTDRGTQIAFADKMQLNVLFEGSAALFNPYHIMAVNPKKHPSVNYSLAKKYINFVVSPQGQQIIADYTKQNQQLFYPDALY